MPGPNAHGFAAEWNYIGVTKVNILWICHVYTDKT